MYCKRNWASNWTLDLKSKTTNTNCVFKVKTINALTFLNKIGHWNRVCTHRIYRWISLSQSPLARVPISQSLFRVHAITFPHLALPENNFNFNSINQAESRTIINWLLVLHSRSIQMYNQNITITKWAPIKITSLLQ